MGMKKIRSRLVNNKCSMINGGIEVQWLVHFIFDPGVEGLNPGPALICKTVIICHSPSRCFGYLAIAGVMIIAGVIPDLSKNLAKSTSFIQEDNGLESRISSNRLLFILIDFKCIRPT